MPDRTPLEAALPQDAFDLIPLLDDVRLGKLRAVLPPAPFQAIIQSYIDSAFFAALQDMAAPSRRDFIEVVHNCKGTSANLGASRVQAVAAKLEVATRAGDAPAVARLFGDLQSAITLTHRALAMMA